MARMDLLSDAITGIREDIRVNFGASETVRRANEHTREELRDTQNMIADMRRQLLSMGERLAHLEQKPAHSLRVGHSVRPKSRAGSDAPRVPSCG